MADLHVRVDAPIGGLQLRADLTLTAPWTVLFGASGSGKSSILRLIAGLWTPRNSAILLDNEDLTHTPPHRRRIGLVAQQPALFPHMTARQNIAFAAKSASIVDELIASFHLQALTQVKPRTLSGGERQRVAIARALAASPLYLLLDEVFTGMHRPQQSQLIQILRNTGTPILSVTHDVAEALESATETLKIEDGHITAQGPTSDILAPEREAQRMRLNDRSAAEPGAPPSRS